MATKFTSVAQYFRADLAGMWARMRVFMEMTKVFNSVKTVKGKKKVVKYTFKRREGRTTIMGDTIELTREYLNNEMTSIKRYLLKGIPEKFKVSRIKNPKTPDEVALAVKTTKKVLKEMDYNKYANFFDEKNYSGKAKDAVRYLNENDRITFIEISLLVQLIHHVLKGSTEKEGKISLRVVPASTINALGNEFESMFMRAGGTKSGSNYKIAITKILKLAGMMTDGKHVLGGGSEAEYLNKMLEFRVAIKGSKERKPSVARAAKKVSPSERKKSAAEKKERIAVAAEGAAATTAAMKKSPRGRGRKAA